MSVGSELIVLVGIKKAGKKTIRTKLQKFFPQHFPEDNNNILCVDIKKQDLKSFPLKQIPLETFQSITVPIFVISYEKDKLRVQQDFFEKFDEVIAEHLPKTPLLILLHKKDQYVDPIQKKDVLEDCTRCFRRKKGRKRVLISTSYKDYSLKRAFNKAFKQRPVVQPSAPMPPTAHAPPSTAPSATEPLPVAPVVPRAKVEPQPIMPSTQEDKPPSPVEPVSPDDPKMPVKPSSTIEPPVTPLEEPKMPQQIENEAISPKSEPFPLGGLSELGAQIKAEMKDADLSDQSITAMKETKVQEPSKIPSMEPDPYTEQILTASKQKLSRSEFLDVLKQELDEPESLPTTEHSEPQEAVPPEIDIAPSEAPHADLMEEIKQHTNIIQDEIQREATLNELRSSDESQIEYRDNGDTLADMTEIIEWSERIIADEDVEDLEEFSRAVELINFLETITTDLKLNSVSLFDIGSREEIVTTGVNSMPPEIQQAFLDAMSHAEPLSPTQIYGQVLKDPSLIMAVRKITTNVAAVFIYNQTNELFQAQIGGTSEQIRTYLPT